MKIVQISDLHILNIKGVAPWRYFTKRLIGGTNLILNRRKEYKVKNVKILIDQILTEDADHIVFTGDLSNLATQSEFEMGRELFNKLGDGKKLSVIPGNHDSYTRRSYKTSRFQQYMENWIKSDLLYEKENPFPYVKIFDQVAIVGFSSSIPTCPLCSAGKILKKDIDKLDKIFQNEVLKDKYKIALVHHHLENRGDWDRKIAALRNREQFLNLLSKYGIKTVFHGHRHRWGNYSVKNSIGETISVFEVPASARSSIKHSSGYGVYNIDKDGIKKYERVHFDTEKVKFNREEITLS